MQFKTKLIITKLILIAITCYLYFEHIYIDKILVIKLKSNCECNKEQELTVEKRKNVYKIKSNKINYELTTTEFEQTSFQCDLYNSLKRGKNQKVISYTLYGTNQRYYNLSKQLSKLVKQLYPGWIMRIYYDDSINKSIICEIECQKDYDNHLIANTDFCNINKLPAKNTFNQTWNASYIHPSIWRFLTIGDSFVDLFMSRDLDSFIFQRELDSVNFWLNSNKMGHIMRDHPDHRTHILAGMWGLYIAKNRSLTEQIYQLVVNKTIANIYKNPGHKWSDQFFLRDNVYLRLRNNSIIHDSYLCSFYKDSIPYPKQRMGDCHIGLIGNCNKNASFLNCPIECRPKGNSEWITC